jgi:hypothetical protein
MIQGKMPIWAVELLKSAANTPNSVKDRRARTRAIDEAHKKIAKERPELFRTSNHDDRSQ